MTLTEAAAQADELAQSGSERELATLRQQWDEEVESAARSGDYRERAVAYRAIGQFRFRQKLELLRRGLEDDEPGGARLGARVRAAAVEGKSRPGQLDAALAPHDGLDRCKSGRAEARHRLPAQRVTAARGRSCCSPASPEDDDEEPDCARRRAQLLRIEENEPARRRS
jgi:hypothetical protein